MDKLNCDDKLSRFFNETLFISTYLEISLVENTCYIPVSSNTFILKRRRTLYLDVCYWHVSWKDMQYLIIKPSF